MFLHGSLPDAIPQLQTRQALLILDIQNDFVSMNSKLPVSDPPELLDRIRDLATSFRDVGDVIWIRSEFEAPRKVNDEEGEGESVITDEQLPEEQRGRKLEAKAGAQPFAATRPSQRAMKLFERAAARNLSVSRERTPETEEESETFLSESADGRASCCRPNTFGSQFAFQGTPLIDESIDTILTKSHYSAFHDTSLVTSLRGSLVTDLFICGLMSNISVYATALDAAKHGFSMTLIDDCLGYRSRARHDEAVRLMTEYMGADVITYQEIVDDIRKQVPEQEATGTRPMSSSSAVRPTTNSELSTAREAAAAAAAERSVLKDGASATVSIDSGVADVAPLRSISPESCGTQRSTSVRKTTVEEEEVEEGGEEEARHVDKRPRSGDHTPSIRSTADSSVLEADRDTAESTCDDARSRMEKAEDDDNDSDGVAAIRRSIGAVTQQKRRPSPAPPVGAKSPPTEPVRVPSVPKVRVRQNVKQHAAPRANPTMKKLGPNDPIGEGDSRVVPNLWPSALKDNIFEKIKDEVRWQKMYHRGGEVPRLVAVEGDINEDGSSPVYRHPADESPPLLPFTPFVAAIRDAVQNELHHPVNHVLIQYYRDGQDYISEHSDKTLDIVRGSNIVNVSLGAERVMTLRTKRPPSAEKEPVPQTGENRGPSQETDTQSTASGPVATPASTRRIQRIPLPHNSMFVLGPKTNERWLHGIRQDKRLESERSDAELAFNGERISLTFRHIGTFLDRDCKSIWGQGATSKVETECKPVINGDTPEAEAMIKAFGRENQQSDFDWPATYGHGFDVLDTVSPTKSAQLPRLLLSGDSISDRRVRLMLAEAGVAHEVATEKVTPSTNQSLVFVDNDASAAHVEGDIAILLYLETYYRQNGAFGSVHTREETGAVLTRIYELRKLAFLWGSRYPSEDSNAEDGATSKQHPASRVFKDEMAKWDHYASRGAFVAGSRFSIADCAFWPLLDEIAKKWREWNDGEGYPVLRGYWEELGRRRSVRLVVDMETEMKMKMTTKEGGEDAKATAEAEAGAVKSR